MMLIKIVCPVFFFAVTLNSCKKQGTTENSTSGNTPSFPTETVKAFFISSSESGSGIPNLTVFEPNGTIRWKRAGRGGSTDYNKTYANDIIYSSEPTNSGSISNFYAYNINTGVDVWSKTGTNEFYFYPIVRNDTLFCSTMITGATTGNIAAFNALTGALYWRKNLSYPYYPVKLLLDGNKLFFIVTTSPTDSKIVSFNIATRTVDWESQSIGINLGSVFSNIVTTPTNVIVTSGTKLLVSFNRNNGTNIWSKPGMPFNQPLVNNNTVFAAITSSSLSTVPDSLFGIYAFDGVSGNRLWKWQKHIALDFSAPFITGNVIYYCGIKKDSPGAAETGYINALNLITGTEFWITTTTIAELPYYPVGVGNKVYAFNPASGAPGSFNKLITYDGFTGKVENTIQLTGVSFGKVFIVGTSDKVYTPN